MFAVYLRAPDFYRVFPHARAWMYVSVNAQRRAFMASVDGQAEFAFHAAVHAGEDADAWGEADARRVFAEALGRQIPIEMLSCGTWTAGHSLVARSLPARARVPRRRCRAPVHADRRPGLQHRGGRRRQPGLEAGAGVLRGVAGPALLDSYETERKPLAERNTGYARQLRRLGRACSRRRPQLEEDSAAGAAARAEAARPPQRACAAGIQHPRRHLRRPLRRLAADRGRRQHAAAGRSPTATCPPPARADARRTPGWRTAARCSTASIRSGRCWCSAPRAPDPRALHGGGADAGAGPAGGAARSAGAARALYEAPLVLVRPDQIVAWRGHDARAAAAVLRQASGLQGRT